MGTLRVWWQKLTGGEAEPAQRSPRTTAPSRQSRPPAAADDTEGLALADEPPVRKRARVAAAGFDPYASDAGYSKPHTWERVDRG